MRITVLLIVLVLTAVGVMGGRLPQGSKSPAGKFIQIDGQVSVNGTNAIAGATVFSDSTITTAARSSVVVSLGKLGRVEVMPSSTTKLIFGDESVW